MKRSIITIAVLSSVFISAGAVAATGDTYDSGVLKINGKVVGTTCQFIDSNTAEISLNEVGMDKLSTLPVGQAYTPVVNGTQQPLRIKCDGNKTPRVTFSASQFDDKKVTFNNGDAKGVGLRFTTVMITNKLTLPGKWISLLKKMQMANMNSISLPAMHV